MIKMKYFFFSIFLLNIFFCAEGFAQRSSGGAPMSFQSSDNLFTNRVGLTTVALPVIDNNAEQARAINVSQANCSDCENPYYGTGIDVEIDIKTDGSLEILEDGSKLWLLKMESSTAHGLQFYFDKFKLPFGARLFIFNEDKTMVLGAFTSNNNPTNETNLIKFGTQPIIGGDIYIEYHEPNNSEFEGVLSITKVIHIFNKSGPWAVNGGAGPCHINVSCPEGIGWENEINSVVLILGYNSSNNFESWCSGALINNRHIPKKALLLSANHCIDDNTSDPRFDYSTWMFIFNHQTSGCGDNGSNVPAFNGQSKFGSTHLASDATGSPTSDFLLLDIGMTETEVAAYGACYAGWDANMVGFSQSSPPFVGIHHPQGDVKKISIENNALAQTIAGGYSQAGPGRNHWKVNWDKGTTEGGSSGSPLFSSQHRIIGQLNTGNADCNGIFNNGGDDWYGMLSVSINSIFQHLDPLGFNAGFNRTMDTECATSLVGPGGTNGVPASVCEDGQFHQAGFYINGKQGVVEVCTSSPITLLNGCSPLFYPKIRRVDGSSFFSNQCSNLQSAGGYFDYDPSTLGCTVWYAEIFISVTLVNSNTLVPIGTEFTKMQGFKQPLLVVTNPTPTTVGASMGSFDLRNYLPSPYISFVSGQTYRVKLASSGLNGWSEYTNYIHFYTDNRQVNNATITGDIYGKTITINNSTVTQPVEVVAEEKITINSNSTLFAGVYRIDAVQSCSSFRIAETNDNVAKGSRGRVQTHDESYLNEITLYDQEMDKSINPRFNIYPNPNNGQFNIELKNNGGVASIEVYDMMGKQVFAQNDMSTKLSIDISNQPKGIYFVKVNIGEEVFNEKIIYQ
jgi:Secretion system C-terminal sorting domain